MEEQASEYLGEQIESLIEKIENDKEPSEADYLVLLALQSCKRAMSKQEVQSTLLRMAMTYEILGYEQSDIKTIDFSGVFAELVTDETTGEKYVQVAVKANSDKAEN